jgi:hypothetical protein
LNDDGHQITEHRSAIRAGLLGLAVPILVIGAWALVAPHNWYREFPIGTGHWVSSLGPYDEHLVRDFGSLYLALGLLLVFAAIALDRLLVQAVLGGSLVFQVPHFIFHASNTEPFSTANNVVNLALLAAGLVLTVLMLAATSRRSERPRVEPSEVKGGIGYGTR